MPDESPDTPRVVAIGGVFLFSERPAELADWYAGHLGLRFEHSAEYGAWFAQFPYREPDAATERYALFSVLTSKERPRTVGSPFTLNLRVHDLPGLIERLRAAGVEITDSETHPQGLFAWCHDPDGNRLELWEDTAGKAGTAGG